jgi:hypothetical protein
MEVGAQGAGWPTTGLSPIEGASQEGAYVPGIGILLEHSKAHRAARKVIDHHGQPVAEGPALAVFCLPVRHRVRMRTSNLLERLNREITRRTRVVSIFPNDAALLRLASAVLMEVDEDWMSGRKYLTMETQ